MSFEKRDFIWRRAEGPDIAQDDDWQECPWCEYPAPLNEDGICQFCEDSTLGNILICHASHDPDTVIMAKGIIQCFHIMRGLKP